MIVGELPMDGPFVKPLVRPGVKLDRPDRAPIAKSEQLESEFASLGGTGTATVDEEADGTNNEDDAQPVLSFAKDSNFLSVPKGDHDPDSGQQLLSKSGGSILSNA
uniref:Uncharacterized protein n=1 Tax=Anopheles maculatus TaxID=74869 RepID=A0A182TCA0_9DIPT